MKKDSMNPCQWKFPKYKRTVNLSHTEGKLGTQQAIWSKLGSAGMMRNRDQPLTRT